MIKRKLDTSKREYLHKWNPVADVYEEDMLIKENTEENQSITGGAESLT